jgi:hypothetical protein
MPTIIEIFLLPFKTKYNLSYILRFTPYVTENSGCFSQIFQANNAVL